MKVKASVFIGTSLDGFIARVNGEYASGLVQSEYVVGARTEV